MDIIELTAEARTMTGKKGAKACRNRGQLPGILYGKGDEPKPLAVDPKQLDQVLHTHAGSNVIIKLVLDDGDEPVNVVVRELQVDNIKGSMRHVDFYHILLDEMIRSKVPFKMVGEAPGVKVGGILEHILWDMEIECLPMNIPDSLDVDISGLEIGDGINVSGIPVPADVTVLSDPDSTVVQVIAPRVEEEPEPEVEIEGEEPEVIAEGAKAEEASEEKETAEDAKE
jgi:large subunit ribosomal protein L25